jgi:GTPase
MDRSPFVDEARIWVKAGDGGNGCVAFRREKFMPRGGPSGGDGGDGGHVIFVADPGLRTLLDFKYRQHYESQRGEHGRGKDQYGARGVDLRVAVPPGTLAYDEDTGDLLADIDKPGMEWIAARGGRGGRGNIHFASSVNRAPRTAEPGEAGEERRLRLELRLLADVGVVGFPNAGKSSLLARVSAARPKVADYPFTTLTPHLGVVELSDGRSFVMADVPGLIEGAHEGRGLGHQFLRHLTRTRVLLHLIDVAESGREPLQDYDIVRRELQLFDAGLAKLPEVVAVSKMDRPDLAEKAERLVDEMAKKGVTVHRISSATGAGSRELLEVCWQLLSTSPHLSHPLAHP